MNDHDHDHDHQHDLAPCGRIAVCVKCGGPFARDRGGLLRQITALEFEALPNALLRQLVTMTANREGDGVPACGIPSYALVASKLGQACCEWAGEHPGVILTLCLPRSDHYVAAMLTDVKDKIAQECPDTRSFLDCIDDATEGQATLSQLRVVLSELGGKMLQLNTGGDA